MSCFLTHLVHNPEYAPAHYQMARAFANSGQLEQAQTWCQGAIERDPLLTEAHYTLALIYQEQGELDEATTRLKKALYLDPDFILAHFSLANLYHLVGSQNQAARHRRHALRLASKVSPDHILPGSDSLTAAQLLTMIRATL
jgi:chemotaxis protein methyltransferase CheR